MAFYYSVATLFRISSIFFMWPMVFWSIWNVFVPRTQVFWYSFALRPSFSRELYCSKPLIGLNVLLIKVSVDLQLNFYGFSGESSEITTLDKIEIVPILGCKYLKSRRFFLKTNRQAERLSEIVFRVVVKVCVQLTILPKFVASLCVYFFTDAGRDSFQLPLPIW